MQYGDLVLVQVSCQYQVVEVVVFGVVVLNVGEGFVEGFIDIGGIDCVSG